MADKATEVTGSQKKLLDLIKDHGPCCVPDVVEFTNYTQRTLNHSALKLLAAGLVHIVDWSYNNSSGGKVSAVYQAGPGKSIPRPVQTPERTKQNKKDYARKRIITNPILAKIKANVVQDPNNPNPFLPLMLQIPH